jgi:hypothetical protein
MLIDAAYSEIKVRVEHSRARNRTVVRSHVLY